MASHGAGASSSGQNIRQEQADENMMRATKRALEGSAENQEPDDSKVHAARLKLATSGPAVSDVVVAQNQLPQQDPPRDLQDRGRVGRKERLKEQIGIRSQPSRSPRPIAKRQV